MLSPAGVLSGTSGKQKTTQEWISAKLNCPTRLSLFIGLCDGQRQEQEKYEWKESWRGNFDSRGEKLKRGDHRL